MRVPVSSRHLITLFRTSRRFVQDGKCSRCQRRLCSLDSRVPEWDKTLMLDSPELNFEYLCNPENSKSIHENIINRKGVGDIFKLVSLWQDYNNETGEKQKELLRRRLVTAAADIPNNSHPDSPVGDEDMARQITLVGKKREFDFKPKTVVQLGESLGVLRTDNVSMTTGERTYYFKHDLAKLEAALIKFTLDEVLKKGFQLVTVPDMIHPGVIESCGFKTSGERTQVYKLNKKKHGPVCLAGTSEMPLAGFFSNESLDLNDLPIKLTSVSRCYRAETSELQEEKGIYRVHQFTKVEMFAVTADESGTESCEMMEELSEIQTHLFSTLGLHFRVLDMPTHELGAPAYRKYDVETWMPAKQFWGEISSTSNCTDYQSRRLHIKYQGAEHQPKHVHTVNGTACAVPRMIMAILESNQNQDGSINVPEVLQPYMGKKVITKCEDDLRYSWIKLKKIKSRR